MRTIVGKTLFFAAMVLFILPFASIRAADQTRKVVFAASMENDDLHSEIYVMDSDGSHLTQLTTLNQWACDPEWSPDGRQIVFVLGNSNTCDGRIEIMSADGSN